MIKVLLKKSFKPVHDSAYPKLIVQTIQKKGALNDPPEVGQIGDETLHEARWISI